MRKLLIAGVFILAACDGPGMDVFVGHTEQTLRDTLGVPTAVVYLPEDGSRILNYRLGRDFAVLPGVGPEDGPAFEAQFCSTNFRIRDGIVAGMSQFGNTCPVES